MKTPITKPPKKRRLFDELVEGMIALKDDREGRIVLPRIYVDAPDKTNAKSKNGKSKKRTR